MNNRLLTAWLIVFMVLLIIGIGFAMFEGISFYSGGNFTLAFLASLGICVFMFFMFFLPQQLKGSAGDFNKKIWIERWLVFPLAPLTLLIAMLPISHFLNIQHQKDEIVSHFTCAVDTAKAMFVEYEDYAHDRMQDFNYRLRHQKQLDRQNKLRAMELQLLSASYDTLHVSALRWIEASIDEPSTLDVFLMGNIDEIEYAIEDWNLQLEQFSRRMLSDEPESTARFAMPAASAQVSKQLLEDLRQRYRQTSLTQLLTPRSLFTLAVLWLLLMLPYLFQQRHSKSDQKWSGSKKIEETVYMFYWEN